MHSIIFVIGGEKYIITTSQVGGQWGAWYDASNNFISGFSGYDNPITAPNNAVYCRFTIEYNDNNPSYASNVMFEKGQTRSTYEPYKGQTAIVNFGQTVYGGQTDVTGGKVNVTHGIVDLGSLSWTPYNNTFYAQINNAKSPSSSSTVADIICSQYEADSLSHVLAKTTDGIIAINDMQSRVHIYDSAKSSMTGADFKTAMSGVMFVYELATPIEITTTPENLTAISGENNVYADTGDLTEVAYFEHVDNNLIKLIKACQL